MLNSEETFFNGIELGGRVANYKLKPTDPTKALLPVLEAIVNSIHSIEESGRQDGKIDIIIERGDSSQLSVIPNTSTGNELIQSFIIQDNGIGFDDSRFKAFVTSDTSYKNKKGGKGIGRFSWLKAFDHASVESSYVKSDFSYERKFNFRLTKKGIHEHSNIKKEEEIESKTSIKLNGYKKNFSSQCPKTSQSIANRIIEYCLLDFLENSIPLIYLYDKSRNETHSLNKIFKSGLKTDFKEEKIKCGKHFFYVKHVKIYSATEDADHRIYLCGQKREVKRFALHTKLPLLRSKMRIYDKNIDKNFIYSVYISGKYLDENVNSERTDFNISEHRTPALPDEVSIDEILERAIDEVKIFLKPVIDSINIENKKKIKNYICIHPKYRLLLTYKSKSLEEIPPHLTETELEIALYKIYRNLELEIKEKSIEFLSQNPYPKDVKDIELSKKKYLEFIEKNNAIGKSKLTEYVVHRKSILDLLEQRIKVKNNGKYYLEEDVHRIIFPTKKTSNEVSYDQQNLWIIDEKLSYHNFLASDKPFASFDEKQINSQKRPDLAIFDINFAFAEKIPYSSITIVEFKRPMREDYKDDENPIIQVYNYIDDIRAGTAKDIDKRIINIGDDTPFYAYIICDITKKIKDWVKNANIFTPFPSNDGYFGYAKEYKAFIEVISFDKVVADAKQRNSVLFDQLNISNY